MMDERGDLAVVHEPFSHVVDFGEAVIGDRVATSESGVIDALRRLSRDVPVFFKDTTDFHYPGLLADTDFLRDAAHTFLIRDPEEVIASHFALDPDADREAMGFRRLHEIHAAVDRVVGRRPPVITAEDLVETPERTVEAYCAAVGLPYRSHALSWEPGMLPSWRRAERWHHDVAHTSGFSRGTRTYQHTVHNHARLASYRAYHEPYYQALHATRLVV
ncbi:hypothetical protein DFP74_4115 [Nocardiopsis sp. Huas11]|nr:hypothetical protein DFP74_4115 [Nocardiopsis sp. Huas11]